MRKFLRWFFGKDHDKYGKPYPEFIPSPVSMSAFNRALQHEYSYALRENIRHAEMMLFGHRRLRSAGGWRFQQILSPRVIHWRNPDLPDDWEAQAPLRWELRKTHTDDGRPIPPGYFEWEV